MKERKREKNLETEDAESIKQGQGQGRVLLFWDCALLSCLPKDMCDVW